MDLFKIPEKILDVDVVLTCEGEIDNQTSYGKGPGVIAKLAHDQKVACIGLCGQLGADYDAKTSFFHALFPINKRLLSPGASYGANGIQPALPGRSDICFNAFKAPGGR